MAATDCPALPKGWKREEIIRKNGLSSGKIDVFYYRYILIRYSYSLYHDTFQTDAYSSE